MRPLSYMIATVVYAVLTSTPSLAQYADPGAATSSPSPSAAPADTDNVNKNSSEYKDWQRKRGTVYHRYQAGLPETKKLCSEPDADCGNDPIGDFVEEKAKDKAIERAEELLLGDATTKALGVAGMALHTLPGPDDAAAVCHSAGVHDCQVLEEKAREDRERDEEFWKSRQENFGSPGGNSVADTLIDPCAQTGCYKPAIPPAATPAPAPNPGDPEYQQAESNLRAAQERLNALHAEWAQEAAAKQAAETEAMAQINTPKDPSLAALQATMTTLAGQATRSVPAVNAQGFSGCPAGSRLLGFNNGIAQCVVVSTMPTNPASATGAGGNSSSSYGHIVDVSKGSSNPRGSAGSKGGTGTNCAGTTNLNPESCR